jgi:flagellin
MSVIQTNISALNAYTNLNKTGMSLAKSIGKLSSGFRINRAADDAAGLGIANKMRADLRAFRQATRNSAQANAVVQTAEGAASTIANILDRMKELAAQGASDNVTNADRSKLNAEFGRLQSEITRIVDTTKYQGTKLVDGSFGNSLDTATSTADNANSIDAATDIDIAGVTAGTYTFALGTTADDLSLTDGNGLTQELTGLSDGAQTLNFSAFGIKVDVGANFKGTDIANDALVNGGGKTIVVSAGNASFLVSASGESSYATDKITLSSLDLSLSTLGVDGDAVDTSGNATTALVNIDSAIAAVGDVLGTIGAVSNRLSFATLNLSASIENLSAAESVIRDADLAQEMVEFTKNQILQQAGTAMLAQANLAPQGVLSLLRG